VLERGALQRKGTTRRIDVRILSTSRRGLEAQVLDGTFREELLFRLAGARLEIPKLADRAEDIELLANHFWTLSGAERELPKSFLMQLQRQDFPGNVRELEYAIARRVALGDAFENEPFARAPVGADLFEQVLGMDLAMSHARQIVVDEFEQRYVTHALAAHGGNVSRAAAASGLTRRYFHMLRAKQRR
jgi:DNA-binding NtrC family response regulator